MDNIYNIVNNEIMAINKFKAIRKAINVFRAMISLKQGIFVGPMPYEITWLLMPC